MQPYEIFCRTIRNGSFFPSLKDHKTQERCNDACYKSFANSQIIVIDSDLYDSPEFTGFYGGNKAPFSEMDAPFQDLFVQLTNSKTMIDIDGSLVVNSVLFHEYEPRLFMCWAAVITKHNRCMVLLMDKENTEKLAKKIAPLINRHKIGIIKSREVLKIGGAHNNKLSRRVGNIIYLTGTSTVTDRYLGHNIVYSHRFLVRGHWRKHEGIGKNRAGERVVEGMTWVSECEKGDKNLPLIKKVRVVC